MGALHEALRNATREQRHAIIAAAYASLPVATRTFTARGHTITVSGRPDIDRSGGLRLIVTIVRDSDGVDVTPPDLNPILVWNPPYLVADAGGDVVFDGFTTLQGAVVSERRYREDVAASLRAIIRDLLSQRVH